ncbi:phospholipase D family protein [Maribacter sp. MMG018]|uniref:phospholipase D family protein n=1 Tax=Maribacter sp. MMG018 TaxID=2822688 RepID=UPI001B395790|nr:phospholipase D family protein [Maribacter sp. MMG018]MBQ4915285.1 phospholipase D family protein [Maribacter sp. MMG018]
MAKFITGKQLKEEVYEIIHKAKKQLLIVSPYIKLDDYFKKALFENHKKNSELHIIIAFGKNEKNPQRSLKKEDLDYFKDFPNISIVFIPNLHAKYYSNEKKGIITSINLYDYSFENNVEFGVISETSLLGGSGIDKEAWEETMKILSENHTIFIRRPNYKKKFLIAKDYVGSETLLDLTDELLSGGLKSKRNVFEFMDKTFVDEIEHTERPSREEFERLIEGNATKTTLEMSPPKTKSKLLSATNLGKLKGRSYAEVIEVMIANGYVVDKTTITVNGKSVGIKYKENAKGDKWIVYPQSLVELL